jgi:hypothetical protein
MLTQFASDTASFNFLKSFCLGAFEIFDLEKYHVERMIQLMENYANLPIQEFCMYSHTPLIRTLFNPDSDFFLICLHL